MGRQCSNRLFEDHTGKAQTELHDPLALEIERIYVKATHHGKKVGQLLMIKP